MHRWGLSRSAEITVLTLALVLGVCLGRMGVAVWWGWWTLAFVLAAISRRRRFGWLLVAVVVLGCWRGFATDLSRTTLGRSLGQTVTVSGSVIDDPARNDYGLFVYTLGSVRYGGHDTGQSIRVSGLYAPIRRGFQVELTGKLRLARGAAPLQISYGQQRVLSADVGPLESWRGRFFAGMRSAMPEPMAGFGLGLLVGVRSLIDKDLQATLTIVGLTHLVAVSGYNLTIIIQAASKVFERWSLFATTAVSLWLIFGFLLVAGFSASIVRAAMVATLGLLTGYYGYQVAPMSLIALPAAITILIKPDYLFSDLGWQLSFLAFFGILVLAPAAKARLAPNAGVMVSLLIESLAAHLTTLPLIMWRFSQLSVIAPLSNIVVLPLVPLAMLLSFISGLAGMFAGGYAGYLAAPSSGLLALMIGLSQWFSTWPAASVKWPSSPLLAIFMYLFILMLTGLLQIGIIKGRYRQNAK